MLQNGRNGINLCNSKKIDFIKSVSSKNRKNVNMKNVGIVIIVIGILMIAYTGFNFITKEKVVDVGPIEINKEENHPVQWSPIVGVVLVVGGIVLFAANRKN